MLRTLSIRDFVLIDNLTVSFSKGLWVLTGETGGGKSILLDGLGLALGARGDASALKKGAEQASITAEFQTSSDHPAFEFAARQGLVATDQEGTLILRRVVGSDGRSRAFVNDQPVTVGILKTLGDMLIEIHGQHDDRGLLNPKGHRALLDAFGGHETLLAETEEAFTALQDAEQKLTTLKAQLVKRREEEEYDRHCFAELQALSPALGEEEELGALRKLLIEGEKSGQTLSEILQSLDTEDGAEMTLRRALRRLERLPDNLKNLLGPVIENLAEAAGKAEEGVSGLRAAAEKLDHDPVRQEEIEARLFEIRGLARKHNCHPDALPEILKTLGEKLGDLEKGEETLKAAEEAVNQAKARFEGAARALTKARKKAAKELDHWVAGELPPLKLEKARFKTSLTPLEADAWTAGGAERVEFEVSTNPGAPFAPLIKIASGGELSRFILGLKVVLASAGSAPTLVFDEVDRGVGGAVADAVGERLARLSKGAQVLVVTHSPQVAARADNHFLVGKAEVNGGARTTVEKLDSPARREEIARMLSGAKVTDKARAAAESLISGAL